MQREGANPLVQAGVYLLARGLPGLLAFLAIPVFTRLLEPAEYGYYALIIAAVSMINCIAFQWLRLSVVRFLPSYLNDAQRLKSTLLGATVLLSGALGALFAIVALLPAAQPWRLVLGCTFVMLLVQTLYELCCEYARATIRPWRYMWLQVIRSGVAVVLGVLLVRIGWGWWGPVVGLIVGMGLAIASVFPGDWGDARIRIHGEVLSKLGRYGVPISITVALAVVIGTSDRFLIAWMLGEGAAGVYAVAVDFTTQTLTLLLMVISMAMFPLAVRAWETHGPAAAQTQMRSNASLMLAVGVPCVVGLSVITPGIVQCFFGESFRGAALQIIPLVAVAALIGGFKAFHFDAAFQFAHQTIHQVWIVFLAAALNIILNLMLIPLWQLHGAIIASISSYALAIVLTIWLGRRFITLPVPLAPSVQVLIASAVMGVALYPLRHQVTAVAVALQILGGAGIYAAALLMMNFLGLREAFYRRIRCGAAEEQQADESVAAVTLAETH